jgi:hypothetical protein
LSTWGRTSGFHIKRGSSWPAKRLLPFSPTPRCSLAYYWHRISLFLTKVTNFDVRTDSVYRASMHVCTPVCRICQLGSIPASFSGWFAFKSQSRNWKLWEHFHGIPWSLQTVVVFVTQISLGRLPSRSLLIHYSIIILTFETILSDVLLTS